MNRKKKNIAGVSGWIVGLFIIERYSDSILGDLDEFYEEIKIHEGRLRAIWWLWLQVMTTFAIFLKESIYRSIAMFRNYFKITVRNLLKDKIYTTINVFGLA
ncbi:MAG: hypothetical protein GY863_06785, partial [bacterium]|nr:hypothetical protein [bacterium]